MSADQTTQALADLLERAVADRGFLAYEGKDAPAHQRLRRAVLEVVDAALEAGAPSEAIAAVHDRVREHLTDRATLDTFYDHVSAPRVDRDGRWEQLVAETNARFPGAGAVHLELGTWTAWPVERQRNLADALELAEVVRLDFEPSYELDVVADARRLPFGDASIDRIGADSVLEHIAHPHQVIRECFRVLRPGGAMFFITPFAFNLHGYPEDYLRYTPSWYEQICREEGFETVAADVGQAQGMYYTLHNTAKTSMVDEAHPAAPALRTLHLLVIELLGTLVPLDRGFAGAARHWFTAVHCLAIKGGAYEASHREREWDRPFVDRCLDLLAAPGTDDRLQREGDRLRDPRTGLRYPILGGIPHFTRPLELRRAGGLLRAAKRRLPLP